MGKDAQRSSNFSGYALFTEEFYKKSSKKYKSLEAGNAQVRKAWDKLSEQQREEYCERAKAQRPPTKSKKYIVPFYTRCAPKQFMQVCKHIKERKELMDRLKKIGFDKLVEVCCHTIQRELCGEFMSAVDVASNNISIRGKTRKMRAKDVHEFLGLPFDGEEIKVVVNNEDEVFKQWRIVYGNIPYKKIASLLTEENQDENFEVLFVMYALGTLLCPNASICVGDYLLKVILSTKDRLDKFDWSSYVLHELYKGIGVYKKQLEKGKLTEKKKNVPGCLYFLMLYCLQNFPLGETKAAHVKDAVAYWDEKKVQQRVKEEKESNRGLLHPAKQSTKFDPENLTHPEIKKTYTRLVSMLGEEMMALQSRLMEGSGNASEEDKDEAEESEAEEEKVEKESWKKRTIDDRQALFDMCTARCNHEEQEQYFVSMYGYFLTRGELQCLQRRRWINDRFMTMVAKTFVGDQKEKDGRVNRHIFSADFMQKMVANPLRWKWEDHEKEILPEYIGYNIGDCDFIFGPTLFEDHWFCYVFETKTMTFHALDSLVDSITFMRLQAEEEEAKKKGGEQQHDAKKKKKRTSKRQFDPKQFMATQTLSLDAILVVTGSSVTCHWMPC
ncbi:uncharacterized protein LOC114728933 [Neltuma alba]|uniref:uncharacterized protein LOC114728933 n=1 Tax=Neltuma alba TaxID=207710 RepID=UPI0010A2E3D8|nr:uncharacterized protein LOC114728933 [Prosopis alba]